MTWRNFVKPTPEVLRVKRVEGPPVTPLKTLSTLKTLETETKNAPPGIRIIRDPQGREIGFELAGPPTQPGAAAAEPDRPAGFDVDLWAQKISKTVERVAAADLGSLAHCRQTAPDLHRRCLESARRVDEAFELGDEQALTDALAQFENTHQQARQFFQGGR